MLTLEILKAAKRFHVTVSFLADTGLKEALEIVARYNLIFKEFPMMKFSAAADLTSLIEGATDIFLHLGKRLKLTSYPTKRSIYFVEDLTKTLSDSIVKLLKEKPILSLSIQEHASSMSLLMTSFDVIEDHVKEFINIIREISRKRNEKYIPIKVI